MHDTTTAIALKDSSIAINLDWGATGPWPELLGNFPATFPRCAF